MYSTGLPSPIISQPFHPFHVFFQKLTILHHCIIIVSCLRKNSIPFNCRRGISSVFRRDFTEHDFETTGSKRAQEERETYRYARGFRHGASRRTHLRTTERPRNIFIAASTY